MGQKPHLAVACLSSGPTGDNDTEFNFSRCICHAYTYLLLLHNLYQIYCLLDSSLLRQQLKNPESSEVTHWGSFGFQVLWAMSVQLAHEMEASWRQVSIWIPIVLTLIHHHENIVRSIWCRPQISGFMTWKFCIWSYQVLRPALCTLSSPTDFNLNRTNSQLGKLNTHKHKFVLIR